MIKQFHVDRTRSPIVLGLTLRYARLNAGLTMRDLGNLANISHTMVANIEHGKTMASGATLRDLFRVLDISYRDDDDFIHMFETVYNRVYARLLKGDHASIQDDMRWLAEQEDAHAHSIVGVEYWLIRFLHAVLSDSMDATLMQSFDILKRIYELYSDPQKQLAHLVIGIDLYNRERYFDAYRELNKALDIGDPDLDPLVDLYRIRTQCRMFMFMDLQQTAAQTIRRFEGMLLYDRAMEVRREQAYANIMVFKFEHAERLLETVRSYAQEYERPELLREADSLMALTRFMQRRFDESEAIIEAMREDTEHTILIRMMLAARNDDQTTIRRLHEQVMTRFARPHKWRVRSFFDILLHDLGGLAIDDATYVDKLEAIAAQGLMAHDQEMLRFAYDKLIEHHRHNRRYKKALEISEQARSIRSFGFINLEQIR